MISPEQLLGIIEKNTQKNNYSFKDLYRNLYNKDMYLQAYSNIYPKKGNMTKDAEGNTIDGIGEERINKIIDSLKNESYQPTPVKRIYIPNQNGKLRPIGVPSVCDKLVQEILRMILEAIYDPHFSDSSHGFRHNKSCHTALKDIKNKNTGIKWWIKGDIKGCFDNINHDILIKILNNKISDERFLRLIRKFLKAGYLENNTYHKTYSGTPQGNIISPILSNIYLNELDNKVEEIILQFNKGKSRKPNPKYRSIQHQKLKIKKELDNKELSSLEKKSILEKYKELESLQQNTISKNEMDPDFKRMTYVRYADDFLIGVIGSQEDCINIKAELQDFCKSKLDLELSEEKTLVINAKNRVRFLGYDIVQSQVSKIKSLSDGRKQRVMGGVTQLIMPHEKVREFLLKTNSMSIDNKGQWKAKSRPELLNNDGLEIVSTFNSEIRGFYNYYSLANNVHKLNKAYGIFKHSFIKTIGAKYKGNKKERDKYHFLNGNFGAKYTNKNGEQCFLQLYKDGFKKKDKVFVKDLDVIPNNIRNTARTSLMDRVKAGKCEMCGDTNGPFEIHHIKAMKNVKKGKKPWEVKMMARNRKTMVLCKECHKKIHGKKTQK